MRLRTIIADDEPMARKGLEEECKEIDFLEVVGMAESSFQALEMVKALRPDLILLDIRMPRLSGLDLVKSLKDPPMVIITTAYSEYALEGYELDVMDYLIKPVDFHRLLKACCKARDFHHLRLQALRGGTPGDLPAPPDPFFFVKCNGKYERIRLEEVLFVEAADNYVIIHVREGKFMIYQTLKSVENLLPATHFMKVHKSFIVALDKISRLEGQELMVENFRIPISRTLKELVRTRIIDRRPF
ncbi:MAG TPA: LytTR family DNA-binding domain-containing protein [Puia sp.]